MPIQQSGQPNRRGERPDAVPPCPSCSSTDVLPYQYGEPTGDVKGWLGAPRPGDEVRLGGCLISKDSPVWYCKACGSDFGRLGDEEMLDKRSKGDG